MRILPPFEDKIRAEVRLALAKSPTLSMTALKEHLEKVFGRDFHFSYLNKIVGKVMGEARNDIDRAKINNRLIQLRQTHQVARERLLKVLYWTEDDKDLKKPLTRDIVEAAKNIVMLDIAVLNAEVANGLYKNLDDAAGAGAVRYPALPSEQRQHIVSAFQKWGMLPPGTVQRLVAEQTTTIHATRVITVTQ
jgi:hypothetical protein